MRSMVVRISVTASPVTGMPSRNLPIRVSAACASASSRGKAQKAAGALDRVHQPEDVIQDLCVVGLLLEPHQLIVDGVQALAGLRQELTQQVIHETGLRTQRSAT
jgi:hypothetical protein